MKNLPDITRISTYRSSLLDAQKVWYPWACTLVQVFVTRMHIIVAYLLSGKCLCLAFKPSSEVVMRHNVSSLREANL